MKYAMMRGHRRIRSAGLGKISTKKGVIRRPLPRAKALSRRGLLRLSIFGFFVLATTRATAVVALYIFPSLQMHKHQEIGGHRLHEEDSTGGAGMPWHRGFFGLIGLYWALVSQWPE
jgi:hypothetical protein